jgi:hypothetical protein
MYFDFCLRKRENIKKIINLKKYYMEKNKSKNKVGKAIAIGAGVVALGAGAYYYFGPKGKKHQKEAKIWITGMKTEIEKNVKKIENLTKPIYQKAVDAIAETYAKKYKEHAKEIKIFAENLKGEWRNIKQPVRFIVKKSKNIPKKANS